MLDVKFNTDVQCSVLFSFFFFVVVDEIEAM